MFSGLSLIECGEALKQMAEVKYALEDNVKQNFLEPLHHLQTKDLKDVMVTCFFSLENIFIYTGFECAYFTFLFTIQNKTKIKQEKIFLTCTR